MIGKPHLTRTTEELLRSTSVAIPERTRFCPDDVSITDYFEGLTHDRATEGVEHHLSACIYCQHRIGMMARLDIEAEETGLPEDLVATVKQLVGQFTNPDSTLVTTTRGGAANSRITRRVSLWATAAVMILALAVVLERPEIGSPGIIEAPGQAFPDGQPGMQRGTRQVRSVSNEFHGPRVLSPERGGMVDPSSLIVRWTKVEGTLYYDIYLLSDAGDLLVKERLTETQWSSAQPVDLEPGGEYFIRVDSFLADGSTVSSDHVDFKIEGGG
jgi:hypothetical protein